MLMVFAILVIVETILRLFLNVTCDHCFRSCMTVERFLNIVSFFLSVGKVICKEFVAERGVIFVCVKVVSFVYLASLHLGSVDRRRMFAKFDGVPDNFFSTVPRCRPMLRVGCCFTISGRRARSTCSVLVLSSACKIRTLGYLR